MRQHKVHYAKQDNKRLPRFGNSNEFELKDYCSEVFRRIQDLKNVDNYEYMQSVFTDQTLKEIISTKKTGCLGPLSRDDRFFIKTLRKSEVKAIIEMLPSYYFHLKKNPSTLLSALYGVHVVKPIAGGSKVYFGVLSNVIPSDVNMYRIYDLKGSSRGRPVKKVRDHVNIISKDPDFDFKFYLDPSIHERLLSQIKSDCEFLETEGVMGYSLCLGVPVKNSCQGHCEVMLYFAIVDIFRNYGMAKHIEHGFKSLWKDSQSMSAVNPKIYSSRFQEFLYQIFRAQHS
ncbi:Phosphatidylinositol 4-phosphate 5-kinase 10 [Linum perenne]